MRTLVRVLLIGTMASVAIGAAEAQQPHATLELTPSHALPGVQVVATLTIANTSTASISIGRAFSATAARDGGTPRPLRFSLTEHGSFIEQIPPQPQYNESPLADLPPITLKGGESRRYFLAPGSLILGNPLFVDGWLSFPGKYDVVVTLTDAAITTNPARLTVDTPTGEDLAVWNAVLTDSRGSGWQDLDWHSTAGDIARAHRSSNYHPIAALLEAQGKRGSDRVAAIRALLAENIPSPYRDVIRLALAEAYRSAADDIFSKGNFDALAAQTDAGRAVLDELTSTPQTEYGREAAEAYKLQMFTRKEWETLYRGTYQPKPKPGQIAKVKPLVQCSPDSASGAAAFGYSNPNPFSVEIPIGERNSFSPAPADRGQVTVFNPGKHKRLFSVSVPAGQKVNWTLDGTTISYPPRSAKDCSDDGHDD